jgi:hypothetical protein
MDPVALAPCLRPRVTSEWLASIGADELSDSQRVGLALLRTGQSLSNIDSRVATRELRELVQRGPIRAVSSGRWTTYRPADAAEILRQPRPSDRGDTDGECPRAGCGQARNRHSAVSGSLRCSPGKTVGMGARYRCTLMSTCRPTHARTPSRGRTGAGTLQPCCELLSCRKVFKARREPDDTKCPATDPCGRVRACLNPSIGQLDDSPTCPWRVGEALPS